MTFVLDARTATPHFPGIGRYVSQLAGALAGRLADSEHLSLLVDPRASSLPLPDHPRLETHSTPISPFGLSQQWRIPPLLQNASVYHSPYYLMPYRPGTPTVLTVYDLIPHFFPQVVSLRARLLFMLSTRLALRAADRIIAISQATRDDFLQHFSRLDPARVTAISLAPALHFKPQAASEIDRVLTTYELPAEFTLYLGINKPHKNLPRLVEAWQSVDAGMPLVIAGAWDERYPEARAQARALGSDRVRFIGRIPDQDLPGLYSACRLFVFPSLYEGFGLPVIEAMACGAPVACSKSSSLPEVGGDAAAYFDPNSTASIARTIADALAHTPDRQTSLRQAAGFTWERTAARTLEIYRSIAYN